MSLTKKNKKVVKKTAKKKIKTAKSYQKNYYYYQKLPKKIIANKYLIVSVNITLFLFTTNNTLRAGVKFFVCTNFLPKIFNDLHRHHKLRHWINSNTCNIEQREETGCKNTNTPTTPTHKKIHPSERERERERESQSAARKQTQKQSQLLRYAHAGRDYTNYIVIKQLLWEGYILQYRLVFINLLCLYSSHSHVCYSFVSLGRLFSSTGWFSTTLEHLDLGVKRYDCMRTENAKVLTHLSHRICHLKEEQYMVVAGSNIFADSFNPDGYPV